MSPADYDKLITIADIVSKRLTIPSDLTCIFSNHLVKLSEELDIYKVKGMRTAYFRELLRELNRKRVMLLLAFPL